MNYKITTCDIFGKISGIYCYSDPDCPNFCFSFYPFWGNTYPDHVTTGGEARDKIPVVLLSFLFVKFAKKRKSFASNMNYRLWDITGTLGYPGSGAPSIQKEN